MRSLPSPRQRLLARSGVLAAIPSRLLPLLPDSTGCHLPTGSVIDAFFYPQHPSELVTCAAHHDPGIVTLVADDFPGLEVCNDEGVWVPVCLGPLDVAVIVGRAWAKFDSVQPDVET